MTIGTVLLAALLVAGVGASALAALFGSQLRASDAAGNGLAMAWFVVALLVGWAATALAAGIAVLLAPHAHHAVDVPWRTLALGGGGLFAAAAVAQVASVPMLARAGTPAALRAVLLVLVAAVPLAVALHATWRVFAWPLPEALAADAAAAVLAAGAVVPWLARAIVPARRASALPAVQRVAYPALVFTAADTVRVVRGADELLDTLATAASLVDARCRSWTVAAGELVDTGTSMPLAAVVARVLALPRLHDDAAEDARARRLVPMQRDVTALSFVLPQ
jgi:hypothetical protein